MANLEAISNPDEPSVDPELVPYIKALQRWKAWRDNVPQFYSTCVHAVLESPSPSVQLYPLLQPDPLLPALQRHAILYSGQDIHNNSGVFFAAVAVDEPGGHVKLSQDAVRGLHGLWDVCLFTLPVPDAPDRVRYCPGRPTLVAAKAASVGIGLYDISSALEQLQDWQQEVRQQAAGSDRGSVDGAGEGVGGPTRSPAHRGLEGEAPVAREEEGGGGYDGLEDGGPGELAYRVRRRGEAEGRDGGGPQAWLPCKRQDGVAMAWSHGGDGTGLRLFSGVRNGGVAEYAVREDGSLEAVSVRQGGHDGDAEVMDLAWGVEPAAEAAAGAPARDPAAPGTSTEGVSCALLASVGTDGRTLLWDPRQRPPALQAPRCHQDVNGVALASTAGGVSTLLASAGDDGIIRVYDIRQLGYASGGGSGAGADGGGGSGGGGSAAPRALYRLKGHNCVVRQLAFSPHVPSLLASADEQGRVLLWELGRTAPLEEGLTTRPELLFAHAGHVLPVDDFGWSTELYGTLASVSGYLDPDVVELIRADVADARDLQGQPPAVEVWRPAADLLPPVPGREQ